MDNLFNGLTGIVLGIVLIIFREGFAQSIIKYQNETFKFHYGEREINATKFVCVAAGVFSIVLGVLFLFGVIDG